MHKCEYACTHTSMCTHIHISAYAYLGQSLHYLLTCYLDVLNWEQYKAENISKI